MATATSTEIPTADLPTLVADLRATRARAVVALEEMRQAQHASAARMAERPGGDTYRRVAGTTSLQRAAEAAERIVASVDRQLASLSPMTEVKGGSEHWANAR